MFAGYHPLRLNSLSLPALCIALVAITAPCACVENWAAVVIGVVAGVVLVASVKFTLWLGIDDPGMCGHRLWRCAFSV
jgi:hypothetical protein